ncbi:clustered mitochondria-domain-containing protein [Baffinella frigidus]|nr:clustered mitochondria-domain-containing protein [Cryptophyta sp. CCMP2293]
MTRKAQDNSNGDPSTTNITSATDVVAAQTTVGETPGDAPQVEDVPEDENFRLVLKTLLGGLQLSFVATTGDTLMDVRQFLTEASETCFYTHYILRHDGVELNDFVEVSTLVERTPEGPVVNLVMAEGLYEDRTVRMHVRRLREILEPPKVTPGSAAFLLLPSVQDGALVSSPLDKTLDVTALETEEEQKGPMTSACHLPAIFDFDFGVPMPPKDPQCLKSVTLSPLNPPPPHRLLHGDLVYLDVVLCDDRACVVTATARGFYVNCTPSTGATRVLNPERDTASTLSYTLVGLLNQLSPAFKRNIVKLMVAHASRDPLEAIAHQSVISPWVVAPRDAHAPDPHRLEDWVANAYGMEGGTISRDWNEEQQSCRELAKDTPRDATLRQRTIFKITADFVEAATKGAVAVIDRCIPPINPMDPTAAQMYVYNSIFFSFAADRPPNAPDGVGHTPSEIPEGAPSGKPEGAGRGEVSADVESALAEQTSYASSNADLVGVRHFSRTDTDGLYTLATALVDYRGSRVVAQSIIPGILQGEQLSSLIYGSVDGGQKVLWHEAFHEKLRAAAAPLHIKECTVVDGSGAEHKIAAPVDCKGIMGSDSRMYLLDLVRITPLDPAFEGDPRDGGLLRWELVHNFLRAKTARPEGDPRDGGLLRWELVHNFLCAKTAAAAADKPEKEVEMLTMNPNIMLSERTPAHAWTLSGEDLAGDEALIRECAASLALAVIPGLVHRFRALAVSPVDGRQLACEMHSEGVNMRYLGAVHAAAHQYLGREGAITKRLR